MQNNIYYVILPNDLKQLVCSILEVHNYKFKIIIPQEITKHLKTNKQQYIVITDYSLYITHKDIFSNLNTICLTPVGLKQQDTQNILFYQLPIIHKEFIKVINNKFVI